MIHDETIKNILPTVERRVTELRDRGGLEPDVAMLGWTVGVRDTLRWALDGHDITEELAEIIHAGDLDEQWRNLVGVHADLIARSWEQLDRTGTSLALAYNKGVVDVVVATLESHDDSDFVPGRARDLLAAPDSDQFYKRLGDLTQKVPA